MVALYQSTPEHAWKLVDTFSRFDSAQRKIKNLRAKKGGGVPKGTQFKIVPIKGVV